MTEYMFGKLREVNCFYPNSGEKGKVILLSKSEWFNRKA
jgi:hypothetical protein